MATNWMIKHIAARATEDEKTQFEDAARAAGQTPSEALRAAMQRVIEEARRGQPREAFKSEQDVLRAHRRDFAAYSGVGDPLLEIQYSLGNRDHRTAILTEIAEDRALVATVARAVELGVNCDDLLVAVLGDFFEREPGAEFAELPRNDLVWLELNFGAKPVAPDHISYISGTAEREMVVSRWRWHRRLIADLVARGINYRELFEQDEVTKGWRLIKRPRLKATTLKGCRTLIVTDEATDEAPDDIPPKPVMSEQEATARALRSPKIGMNPTPLRIRCNQIGKVPE